MRLIPVSLLLIYSSLPGRNLYESEPINYYEAEMVDAVAEYEGLEQLTRKDKVAIRQILEETSDLF